MPGLGRITTIPPGGKLIWRFGRDAARLFESFVEYATGNEIWHLRSDTSTDRKSILFEARNNGSDKDASVHLDSGAGVTAPSIIAKVVSGIVTRTVTLNASMLDIAAPIQAESTLDVTGAITGNLTGNVTGNVTGAVTGNADTATKLATARAINGVNFDGSAPVTVTAAAGTLSGATLAAGVTASSLTSVGTLTGLTLDGTGSVRTNNAVRFYNGDNTNFSAILSGSAATTGSLQINTGGVTAAVFIYTTGGVVFNSATGGDKGVGTLNVSGGIYKNGTAYANPHFVFERAFTGQVVRYADRMRAMGIEEYAVRSLDDLEAYAREHHHFPGFADEADNDVFSGGEQLLLVTEELALGLFDLNRRVKALEDAIKPPA